MIFLHKNLFFRSIVRQGIKLLPTIFQFRIREGNIWAAKVLHSIYCIALIFE